MDPVGILYNNVISTLMVKLKWYLYFTTSNIDREWFWSTSRCNAYRGSRTEVPNNSAIHWFFFIFSIFSRLSYKN